MEDNRSRSCGDGRMQMQMQAYDEGRPTSNNFQDLRCYSASYASSLPPPPSQQNQFGNKDMKFKRGKSSGGSSSSKIFNFNDPELQRKKRVASYKVYAVEGKVKGTFRKSFRWIKDRCTQVVYGWW